MLDLNNLHPYQKKIANFIINRQGCIVCAEMGLGKTVSTLLPIEHLQSQKGYKSALILAPLRVVYSSWPNEIAAWKPLQNMSYHIIHGKGKQPILPKKDLYLANYESLPYIIDKKLYKPCDILVLDESSMVKSHKTKRFKMLKKIQKHFKKVILLTGTPSPSGDLHELFTQTFMIDGGQRFGGSFHQFRNHYYTSDFMGYNWELRNFARPAIQKKVRPISISLKAKDYLQLPDCIRTTLNVQIPTKAYQLYKEFEKDFIIQLNNDIITAANAAVMSGKLRQITAGGIYNEEKKYTRLHNAKIDALKEIVETTESNILCAFQFKFERRFISQAFPQAKFIDGSTSAKESNQIITDWNNKKIKLLCCHPQSVGHGLNLQHGGNVLVWLSPDWSLERTLQMDARVYRQGQKKKVFIYTIAADRTIDHIVIESLKNKDRGQEALLTALKQYAKTAKAA